MYKYLLIIVLFSFILCDKNTNISINYSKIDYELIPATFEIFFIKDNIKIPVSIAKETNEKIFNIKTNDNKITLEYKNISA